MHEKDAYKYPITKQNMIKIIFALIFLYVGCAISGEIIEGVAIGIHDGDTLNLLVAGNQTIKIRLSQVDSPESDQAFGQKSRRSLSDMVFNKAVRVEKETVDKYGRTVGTVFVGDLDVNRLNAEWHGLTGNTYTINPYSRLKQLPGKARLVCGQIQTRCRHGNIGIQEAGHKRSISRQTPPAAQSATANK